MGMMTFLAHEHILDATGWVGVGWGGDDTKEFKFSLQHCTESLA